MLPLMVRYFLSSGSGGMADALDSGSSEVKLIQVQVLLSAPQRKRSDQLVEAFSIALI